MSYIEIINIIQWLASIIVLVLCFYVGTKTAKPSSSAIMGLLAFTGVWCLFAVITLSVDSLEAKIILNRVKMLGPIFLPYFVLKVASMANGEIKTPEVFVRFIFVVAVFYGALTLSPYHELMITEYGIKEIDNFKILTFVDGPMFLFHNIIARATIVSSFIILMIGYRNRHIHHTKNNMLILFAFLVPFLVDNAGVIFYQDIRFLQLVPVAFTFTGGVLVYLLLNRKVLEVMPYTRSKIVDNLVEPCFMWGAEGQLIDCNEAASKVFGVESSLFEFDEKKYPSLKKNNSDIFYKERYFKVNYQTLSNEGETSEGAFTILSDITSEKKIALELQKLSEVKSSLLGILSHDLTGHIGQLSFISEILSRDLEKLSSNDREELSKNLGNISEDVRIFIQDILQWSQEQNGEWRQDQERFDVEKLLASVVGFMKPLAQSKSIKIFIMESEKVEIKTDQTMSAIIFRNLIYNAIKHSPPDSEISLRLQKDALLISNTAEVEMARKLNEFFLQNDQAVLSGGLGLKMVREFSGILNMKVSFSHFESSLIAKVSWL